MATKNRLLWSCLRGAPSKMGLLDRGLESFVEFVPLDSEWIFFFCFFLRKKEFSKYWVKGIRGVDLSACYSIDSQTDRVINLWILPPHPHSDFLAWNEMKERKPLSFFQWNASFDFFRKHWLTEGHDTTAVVGVLRFETLEMIGKVQT
jgi:hypothetical protein